jgi:hypothetical protein
LKWSRKIRWHGIQTYVPVFSCTTSIAVPSKADHAGRLQIGTVNGQFIAAGASPSEYKGALRAAIERGYLIMHPSGGYVTFTLEGADLFA